MNKGSSHKNAVLFICTANICRSPMAVELFKMKLQAHKLPLDQWRVESAGTWAQEGEPASEGSSIVMLRRGVDLSEHRSRMVSKNMLKEFDLILTMEAGHKEALQIEFPEFASRIFMLSEMQGVSAPVRDPYGGPLTGYEVTVETIDRMLAKGFYRIVSLVEANQAQK